MKKNTLRCMLPALTLLLLGCSQTAHESETVLARQNTSAVLWVQNSAEYYALVTQAFNMARYAFDQAESEPGKKKAVVVDIDETIMNNAPYEAHKVQTGELYSKRNWNEWIGKESAKPVPGAIVFANYVIRQGGEVFYVSNRKQTDYLHTMNNLIKVGFPQVSSKTLLLRDDMANKQQRFNKISDAGYDIVVYLGDNLDDFGSDFYRKKESARKRAVSENAPKFGRQFIIMPNPMYGSWENVLTDKYPGLNVQEKTEARLKLIRDADYRSKQP
ncbi:5'-nucleotidase, lipoprotein e(P4) family [Serratia marcescens]|uniref:5'-nucleotidase, lipoprotein e(P4) family n=1 Tax=Serratia marcescens TaxID=615 RepID=A0A1Q4NUZ4_SERMA|nr:5'-nucleotidase, lipoprotein e(P4) family [Serratia marcescens]OKB64692.1 5'-nucleotidase, lipoprotein e(P4) family [Serratia marcescens]